MTKPQKKVVRAESLNKSAAASATAAEAANWVPTPEAKQQATTLRIVAWVCWVLAIGFELLAIFWVLRQVPFETSHLIWLIVIAVVIGGLAIAGSLTWKKANRLDPASENDKVRFFVQNQLGVLMTLLAFVPLVIMVFANKNMDAKQKTIAGVVTAVIAVVALVFAPELAPVSKEQVVSQGNEVVQLTGKDEVFWTKYGEVYHLCSEASAVNQESKDNTIYSGTVADALAAGKKRLTKQVELELKQCGITPPSAAPTAPATPVATPTR